MVEDALLQLSPCAWGKHPLTGQHVAPRRGISRQQVGLQILIQQLGLQQAGERQGLEILHRIHPLAWMEAQLPQPGGLRVHQPLQQLLLAERFNRVVRLQRAP